MMPGGSDHGLPPLGKGPSIAERGRDEPISQRRSQLGQEREVAGQVARDADEVIGRMGNMVIEADRAEERDPDAGGVVLSREREDGNTHREGFARCGGAVVGKGIERDVHLVVRGEVVAFGRAGNEIDARGIESQSNQTLDEERAGIGR